MGAMLKMGVVMSEEAMLDHLVMTTSEASDTGRASIGSGIMRCRVIVLVIISVLCSVTVVVGSAELFVSGISAATEVTTGVMISVTVTVTKTVFLSLEVAEGVGHK
jgi:hypothetical protein